MLTDASENVWQRRWLVLRRYVVLLLKVCFDLNLTYGFIRPHIHVYAHSNELDEVGVISISGSSVKVEHSADMDALFDVSLFLILATVIRS